MRVAIALLLLICNCASEGPLPSEPPFESAGEDAGTREDAKPAERGDSGAADAVPLEKDAALLEDAATPIEKDAALLEDAAAPIEKDAALLEDAAAPIEEDDAGEPAPEPQPVRFCRISAGQRLAGQTVGCDAAVGTYVLRWDVGSHATAGCSVVDDYPCAKGAECRLDDARPGEPTQYGVCL